MGNNLKTTILANLQDPLMATFQFLEKIPFIDLWE